MVTFMGHLPLKYCMNHACALEVGLVSRLDLHLPQSERVPTDVNERGISSGLDGYFSAEQAHQMYGWILS